MSALLATLAESGNGISFGVLITVLVVLAIFALVVWIVRGHR